jgi:hypothetical protein
MKTLSNKALKLTARRSGEIGCKAPQLNAVLCGPSRLKRKANI